nr:unnamed protein product [Spirometra erinaceieuropaei]
MSANASLSIDMVCRAFQLPSNMPPSRYLTAYLRTLVNVIFTYLIPRSLKKCYKCCVSQGAMHGVVYMHHQSWRTIVDKHRKDMLETSSFRGPLSEQEFVDLTDWGRVVAPRDVSVDLSALPQRVGACHAQLICKRSGCYRLLSSPKSLVCPPSVYPVLPSAVHLSYLSVAQRLRCPGGLTDFMRHLHTFLPSAFQPSLLSVPACLSSLCEFRDYSRKLGFTNFWVAKLDIEGFFDSIDHAQLRQVFNRVLTLANTFTVFPFNTDFLTVELDNFLNKYIIQLGGQLFCQTRGIPQGSCISADLANLFLANTDRTFLGQYCWALDRTRKVLCKSDTRRSSPPVAVLRYLDDYLCLASSSEHLTCVVDAVKHGVAAVGLRLNSNKEKTNVGSLGQPVMWLGVEVRRDLSLLLPSISPFPLRSSRFKGYPRSVTACIAYLRRSLSQLSHFQFVCADRPKSHLHGCSSFHIGPPVSSCLKTHFANHTNASRLGAYAADVFWNVAKSCPQRSSLLSRNNSRRVALSWSTLSTIDWKRQQG